MIFGVQGSLHQAADDAEAFGRFMDELIAYLEANDFEMARGLGETEKKAIISWLAGREDVATLHATPLVDGFYGDDGWENYSETYKQAD
ncbi:hypothetical protein [Neisseria meningitidis]|uniref:hypothetical protein n=1 Tax=Neisseria meningitidis TaxID=487 RepID=UPI00032F3C7A|nr:hypothetical protein [Neisseria meningitidis]EOC36117.1 hypothetical protein NM2004264_1992 [Neisseria meningitidis 2004264]